MEPSLLVDLLFGDMKNEIGKYLTHLEHILLRRVFKSYQTPFPIDQIVQERLKRAGLPAKEFCEQLRVTKSLLSGSFLLAILLSSVDKPVEWPEGDIDVISRKKEEQCPLNVKISHSNPKTWRKDSQPAPECVVCSQLPADEEMCQYPLVEFFLRHNMHLNVDRESYFTPVVIESNRKWIGGSKRQTINDLTVTVEPEPARLIDTFDFSFCRIAYDGVKLFIWDIEAIRTRSCYYDGVREIEWHHRSNRTGKIERIKNRLNKYTQRGFNIAVSWEMTKYVGYDHYQLDS